MKKKLSAEFELSQVEDLAQKFTRSFIRVAECLRKSRGNCAIYSTPILLLENLRLVNGQLVTDNNEKIVKAEVSVGLAQYDRLTILLSAKKQKIVV